MQRGARRRQVVLLGMGGSSLAPEVLRRPVADAGSAGAGASACACEAVRDLGRAPRSPQRVVVTPQPADHVVRGRSFEPGVDLRPVGVEKPEF